MGNVDDITRVFLDVLSSLRRGGWCGTDNNVVMLWAAGRRRIPHKTFDIHLP